MTTSQDVEQVLEDLGAEFAQQWKLADLMYDRAVELWGRPPTEDEKRQIWAASAEPASQLVDNMSEERRHALASSPEAAPIVASVRAFFAPCLMRPRSATGPRRVRVRTRTRERRSSPAARRTSSTSSGDSSGEPGPGDEPPGDDDAARPSGGAA